MSGENMGEKLQLKVMVNKERNKVLYAVADNHFADILLSFLTLPMGRVVKVLEKYYGDKAPTFGSLNSLYRSLANLASSHFVSEGAKKALINPMSSFEDEYRRLKLDITDSLPAEYFYYTRYPCNRFLCISMYYDTASYCLSCSSYHPIMKKVVEKTPEAATGDGVFTIPKTSFIISDDLRILQSETGFLRIISMLGITDADEAKAEAIKVDFGLSEVMHLLRASLTSPTPLSDLILKTVHVNSPVWESQPIISDENNPNSDNFILRAMIQRSTGKLVYAQAEKNFIEFLLSLLYIPVGRAENLLAGKTCFKAIHNLFRSTSELIGNEWFKSQDIRKKLVSLNLAHGCISEKSILSFTQEPLPYTYQFLSSFSNDFPKGQGLYLEGLQTYEVSDNLTVVPYCFNCILSSLREQKIPISDVEEVELKIGSKEALSILRAALTSSSALTDVLHPQISKVQVKREV